MAEENFDLSAMLAQAMKDPAVAELARNLKASADSSSDNGQSSAPVMSVQSSLPPDIMEKLPSIMGALSGKAPSGGASSGEVERRNRLLSALRPYLNDGRRDMVDKIMSLSKITTMLDLMPRSKDSD